MRNLKKILSLVLALMMVLSLMATASATTFEDDADITYKEAVEVMAGLGVLNGVPNADGTFNFLPKETLNRAAGAKIVAYIANGGALDADLMATLDNPFTDVAGWAIDSVKYCYSQGIVNGIGGGLFDPNNSLDGYAFGKMMLEAAGYDWQSAAGSNWKTKVVATLKANGLLTGIETLSFPAPMTREQACQMAWNIMKSSPDGSVYNVVYGGMTYTFNTANEAAIFAKQIGANPATDIVAVTTGSLAVTNFGLQSANGVITENSANATVATTQLDAAGTKYAVNTGLDLLGHYVTVYYKDAKNVYAVVDKSTVVTVAEDLADVDDFKATFGTDKTFTGATVMWGNSGTPTVTVNTTPGGLNAATGAALAGTYIFNGKALKAVIHADATYSYAVTTADKVTNFGTTAGAETIVLNTIGALNNNATTDVVNEYEGIAKDDIVLVTKIGAIYNLTKAEVVEGKITKKAGNTYTVDGKTYARSTVVDGTGIGFVASPTFTATYNLYLDAAGNYFASKAVSGPSSVSSDIVYVVGAYDIATVDDYGVATTNTYAQIIDQDGVEDRVLVGVKKTGGSQLGVAAGGVSAGFYTYALSSTTAEAALGIQTASAAPTSYSATTPVFEKSLSSNTDFTVNTASVGTSGGKAYVNAETKYIFVTGTKADMKTEIVVGGINSTVTSGAKMLLGKDADGNLIVKAIIAGTTYTDAGVTASDYLYITVQASPAQTADGYEYTVYNAATGEKSTVIASNASVGTAGFYSYTVVDGVYTFGGSRQTEATAPAAGFYYGEAYASKYGTKITTSDLTDVEAGSAVIVDLRSAAAIASSGVPAITSLATINSLKLATSPKTVTFDCVVTATGVAVIFVTNVA